jgi:NhaP-type Na+/H+ or K+/H+ antiporter
MGLAAANLRGFDVPARRPFFETLVQLIIGLLFISISATVTPASLRHLILPTLALAAVLILVTRPLVAWLATARTDMTTGERLFTGWMDPRGIVAAATASTFCVQPVDGTACADGNLLFLVRADGRLAPVTRSGPPEPEPGDSMVVLTARPAG